MSRTLPYRPISVRIATHHTHDTSQFHRISPNRFGKAIRRNSAPVRQGYYQWLYHCQAVCKYVHSASNLHEWLIRKEYVKLCVWFGDFLIGIVRTIRGLVRQASTLTNTCFFQVKIYALLVISQVLRIWMTFAPGRRQTAWKKHIFNWMSRHWQRH